MAKIENSPNEESSYKNKAIIFILLSGKRRDFLTAALWTLAGGALLSGCGIVIRLGAANMHPFQLAFFRNFFGLLVVLPWLFNRKAGRLATTRLSLYILRAGSSLLSMLTFFFGITVLPLVTVMAIDFTTPVFATIGAVLFLGERLSRQRAVSIIGCMVGVLCIAQPGSDVFDWRVLILVVSALAGGVTIVSVKSLSRTEQPEIIVAYFVILLIPLSLVPALPVWQWPSLEFLPYIVLLGIMGTLAHLCSTRAYKIADAAAIAPFDYIRLIYAAVVGYLMFNEVPNWMQAAGASIIVLSIFTLIRSEITPTGRRWWWRRARSAATTLAVR